MRLGVEAAVVVVATLATRAEVVMVLLVSHKHSAPTHTNKGD